VHTIGWEPAVLIKNGLQLRKKIFYQGNKIYEENLPLRKKNLDLRIFLLGCIFRIKYSCFKNVIRFKVERLSKQNFFESMGG